VREFLVGEVDQGPRTLTEFLSVGCDVVRWRKCREGRGGIGCVCGEVFEEAIKRNGILLGRTRRRTAMAMITWAA
jgi:hypothetical protein